MHARYFTVGIGLVLIWASAGTSAEVPSQDDTTMQVICSFSATFADGVESHIDTNNDGVSAVLDHAISNCNIGRFFISGAAEYQAPLSPPETCPAGSTLEFRLQQARGVGIEERTGDQLFVEYGINGLTLCVNGSDGTVTSTGGGTYAGGTGQFEGARGSFEVRATGRYLATGVKDGVFGGFGQYTGRSTGELILPRTRPAPYARAPSTSAPAGASATQACRGRVGPSDRLGGHLPRTLSLVFLSSKHHVLDLPNRVGRGHVWP